MSFQQDQCLWSILLGSSTLTISKVLCFAQWPKAVWNIYSSGWTSEDPFLTLQSTKWDGLAVRRTGHGGEGSRMLPAAGELEAAQILPPNPLTWFPDPRPIRVQLFESAQASKNTRHGLSSPWSSAVPGERGPSPSLPSLHFPAPQAASLHSPAQTGQIVTAEWRKCSLLKLRGGFGCISVWSPAVLGTSPSWLWSSPSL